MLLLPQMTNLNVTRTARNMSTLDLARAARALETDLAVAIARGDCGTRAHVGMLEMLAACGSELARRDCWPR